MTPVAVIAYALMFAIFVLATYIVTWFSDRSPQCGYDPICYLTCVRSKTYNENVVKVNDAISNSSSTATDILNIPPGQEKSYVVKSSSLFTPVDVTDKNTPKYKCMHVYEYVFEQIKEGLSDIKSSILSLYGF